LDSQYRSWLQTNLRSLAEEESAGHATGDGNTSSGVGPATFSYQDNRGCAQPADCPSPQYSVNCPSGIVTPADDALTITLELPVIGIIVDSRQHGGDLFESVRGLESIESECHLSLLLSTTSGFQVGNLAQELRTLGQNQITIYEEVIVKHGSHRVSNLIQFRAQRSLQRQTRNDALPDPNAIARSLLRPNHWRDVHQDENECESDDMVFHDDASAVRFQITDYTPSSSTIH
jgi:hypothetical protein